MSNSVTRSQVIKGSAIGVMGFLIVGCVGFYVGHETSSNSKFSPNAVVAKVGSAKITQADLYSSMLTSYGKATSDSLVINKLISLEAKSKGVSISNSAIQKELIKVEHGYGGKAALQANLSKQGKTMSGLKTSIISYLEMQKLVGSDVHLTNSQIQNYFNQNKSTYNTPKEVRASNILVNKLSTAKMLETKLAGGANFSSLAKKYSIDKTTGKSGGDLGYFKKSSMIPAFANAAFALNVGQLSSPVKTKYGYNIIKVTDIQPAKTATLSSVHSQVVAALTNQQIQADYPTWLVKQENKYHVTDTLDPNIIKESSPSTSSKGTASGGSPTLKTSTGTTLANTTNASSRTKGN